MTTNSPAGNGPVDRVVMPLRQAPDVFTWIIFPLKAATMQSDAKIVRAIGEALSMTVMLPWVGACIVVGLVFGACYETLVALRKWWRKV